MTYRISWKVRKMADRSRNIDLPSEESNIFSLSISDLMAALLLIFILLLSATLLKLQEQTEENKLKLDMISEQETAKRHIIEKLEGEKDQFDIEVDPSTGVIRVKESILFDTGKWNLKKSGKRFLDTFIPKYAIILLSNEDIREQIAQIIIEGHTDTCGSYNYNLDLSLKRAKSVVSHIFSRSFNDFEYKVDFRQLLSANGRSYSDPIDTCNTEEAMQKNRRVEFKFSFKDWTTLEHEKKKIKNKAENWEEKENY